MGEGQFRILLGWAMMDRYELVDVRKELIAKSVGGGLSVAYIALSWLRDHFREGAYTVDELTRGTVPSVEAMIRSATRCLKTRRPA